MWFAMGKCKSLYTINADIASANGTKRYAKVVMHSKQFPEERNILGQKLKRVL